MARVVFFSFDYDDIWRVTQVRNSGRFIGEKRSGFRDKAEYEQVKRRGDAAICNWIRRQMHGCSVTCVLIGAATYRSRWVDFEIAESIARDMGLLGVYVHKLHAPQNQPQDTVLDTLFQLPSPPNPLDNHSLTTNNWFGQPISVTASAHFETHTWEPRDSFLSLPNDLGAWVDEAARRAGR